MRPDCSNQHKKKDHYCPQPLMTYAVVFTGRNCYIKHNSNNGWVNPVHTHSYAGVIPVFLPVQHPVLALVLLLQYFSHRRECDILFILDKHWCGPSARNTPQAFSHFSYVYSNGEYVIVDIQVWITSCLCIQLWWLVREAKVKSIAGICGFFLCVLLVFSIFFPLFLFLSDSLCQLASSLSPPLSLDTSLSIYAGSWGHVHRPPNAHTWGWYWIGQPGGWGDHWSLLYHGIMRRDHCLWSKSSWTTIYVMTYAGVALCIVHWDSSF